MFRVHVLHDIARCPARGTLRTADGEGVYYEAYCAHTEQEAWSTARRSGEMGPAIIIQEVVCRRGIRRGGPRDGRAA